MNIPGFLISNDKQDITEIHLAQIPTFPGGGDYCVLCEHNCIQRLGEKCNVDYNKCIDKCGSAGMPLGACFSNCERNQQRCHYSINTRCGNECRHVC